ncbi:MAG: peptidase [Amycolatopsis sp.]|nr:peptidase [Amycolatopsis sp.]
MRRFVTTLVTTVMLGGSLLIVPSVAASAAAPTADSVVPTADSITWGKCTKPSLEKANAQCGFVNVPLDYTHPYGAKISLAVSRVLHTVPDSQYQGVALANPGGPGVSGLGMSTLGSAVPNGVGGDYDWIGFDPRGVGSSVPALTCDPNYFSTDRPAYVPTTPALTEEWLTRSKDYAQACAKDQPALLQHMTTADSAKDMDSIRATLGQQQITYYGFSWGTYLGEVFSTLFPQRVRRMVLDSNVDPRGVWYQANLDQDAPFERNIKIWFTWVAKYDTVFHLGSTEAAVEKLWFAQLPTLTKQPAEGTIGPDEWTDIFQSAAYSSSSWDQLGQAFAGWVNRGDSATLNTLYQQAAGPNARILPGYSAVQCTDAPQPRSWARWAADNWRIYAQAPYQTWANAWLNAPCLYWQVKPSTPVRIDGAKTASALLIDEELDAATPFEGSLEVRKLYPNSRLIAEPGGTAHADSLDGDMCVDNQVAAYLATGALPPRKAGTGADALCAPLPDPVPATAATADTSGRTQARTSR